MFFKGTVINNNSFFAHGENVLLGTYAGWSRQQNEKYTSEQDMADTSRGGDVEDDSESRSEDSDEEEIGDIILEEGLVDEEEEDDEEDRPAEFHCDVRKFQKPMQLSNFNAHHTLT